MTDAPELKPCPFCGGDARIYQDTSHSTAWFCGCEDWDCFGNMMWDETKTGATDKWNRRADLSSPFGAVDATQLAAIIRQVDGSHDLGAAALADAILAALEPPTHAALLAHTMRLPEVAALELKRDEYRKIANLLSEFAAELAEKFLAMDLDDDDDADMKSKCQAYADGGYRALSQIKEASHE